MMLVIVALLYSCSPVERMPRVFTVDQANALIASHNAYGSLDLYADDLYGDCFVFMMYHDTLFAPEVEHVYNLSEKRFYTETNCYVEVIESKRH